MFNKFFDYHFIIKYLYVGLTIYTYNLYVFINSLDLIVNLSVFKNNNKNCKAVSFLSDGEANRIIKTRPITR